MNKIRNMNKSRNIVMTMLGLATSLYAAEPWTMHKIDNARWNHNSLSPGDLNGDGNADYAVIHKGTEKYTFADYLRHHASERKQPI